MVSEALAPLGGGGKAVPPGEAVFLIDHICFDSGGQPQIEFTGEPGWTYQVEYTDDLQSWHTDLPNSTFPGITSEGILSFTDVATSPIKRFYKIGRSPTP